MKSRELRIKNIFNLVNLGSYCVYTHLFLNKLSDYFLVLLHVPKHFVLVQFFSCARPKIELHMVPLHFFVPALNMDLLFKCKSSFGLAEKNCGTSTIYKSIFGLTQKFRTNTNSFGTCKRTRQ